MQSDSIEIDNTPSPLLSEEFRCQHSTEGKRCNAPKVRGSEYCVFHSPDFVKERAEGRTRGGKEKKRSALGDEWNCKRIREPKHIVKLLGDVANLVMQGRVHPSVGNAVANIANVMLRASEQSDLEQRIEFLEQMAIEMKR